MQTEEGKKIERLLGKLSNSVVYEPLVEAFDKLTELLDEIENGSPLGAKRWRYRIGWEDQ